jgi:hypothetical protein
MNDTLETPKPTAEPTGSAPEAPRAPGKSESSGNISDAAARNLLLGTRQGSRRSDPAGNDPATAAPAKPVRKPGKAAAAPALKSPSPAPAPSAEDEGELNGPGGTAPNGIAPQDPTPPGEAPADDGLGDPTDEPETPALNGELHPEVQAAVEALAKNGYNAKTATKLLTGRIHKLADQRDTERNGRLAAEERVRQIEAERNAPAPAAAPAGTPYAGDARFSELDAKISTTRENVQWLRDNPNGGEVEVGKERQEWTAQQVAKALADEERRLTKLEVRREQMVDQVAAETAQRRDANRQQAVKQFPWLTDRNAPEMKEAVEFVKKYPSTLQLEDGWTLLGELITGRMVLKQRAQHPAPRPASTPAPAMIHGSGRNGRRAPQSGEQPLAQATARFEQSGKVADARTMLAARRARLNRPAQS